MTNGKSRPFTFCNFSHTVLDDYTSYSPITAAKQKILNLNHGSTQILHGIVDVLVERREAVINQIVYPTKFGAELGRANFAISQFRHEDFDAYADDSMSFFAYPVLDSFEPDAQLGGVIASNMFWRLLLSRALPDASGSFVCVIENSYNQTMSYQLDGPNATFLGEGDHHDTAYDHFLSRDDLNKYYEQRFKNPAFSSYTSVPLSADYGHYSIKVYPTSDTEDMFTTNNPWLYTCIVAAVSLFTSLLFAMFVHFVERRQSIVMDRVVESSRKAAETERDLNEFLAHEVRAAQFFFWGKSICC